MWGTRTYPASTHLVITARLCPIYHDSKAKFPYTPASAVPPSATSEQTPFSAHPPESTGLTIIGEFETAEEFYLHFNWHQPHSNLEKDSNYHLFESGITPMWEDEANANGEKDDAEQPASAGSVLELAGDGVGRRGAGDEICGTIGSLWTKVDTVEVWTRGKDEVEKFNSIGKKLVKLLDSSGVDSIVLEFSTTPTTALFFPNFYPIYAYHVLSLHLPSPARRWARPLEIHRR